MWCVVAAALLYPLIDGGWSTPNPIPDSLVNPAAPIMISESQIREQAELYRSIPDPAIRSRIAITLRSAQYPALGPVMDLLEKEKNASAQENLIITLRMLASRTKEALPGPERLIPLLRSASPVVRQVAACLLIRAGTGLPEIEAMLNLDDSPEAVEHILQCLAGSSLRLSAETLKKLALSPVPGIRNAAIRYLAQISAAPDKEKILKDALVRAELEKDEIAQLALVKGLTANTCKDFPAMLEKLVNPGTCSVVVRVEAASMPGTTSDRSDFLQGLLNDPSAAVRATAADSLSVAKRTRSLEKALGRHLNDENASVRKNAAKALSKMVDNELSNDVLNMVSDRRALEPLLIVIRSTKNKKYVPVIAEIMKFAKKEKDSHLLVLSVEALASVRDESMAPMIHDLADYPSVDVRTAVAEGLRVFPGSATVSALRKLIRDSSEKTAITAMDSARVLADPELVPELSENIGKFGQSALFRATACRAFSNMPGKVGSAALKNLEKLILTKCIVVPMGQPAYDEPLPRAMGVLLLLKASQTGNELAHQLFIRVIVKLQNPSKEEKKDGICDRIMAEYIRQILFLRDGKDVTPAEMSVISPELHTEKIHVGK